MTDKKIDAGNIESKMIQALEESDLYKGAMASVDDAGKTQIEAAAKGFLTKFAQQLLVPMIEKMNNPEFRTELQRELASQIAQPDKKKQTEPE